MKNEGKTTADKSGKNWYKTEWDLNFLYKGPMDPKIEKDVKEIEKAHASFSKKYSNKNNYTENENALAEALKDWASLYALSASCRPLWYLGVTRYLNSQDSRIDAKIGIYEPRVTKANNETLFFLIRLGKASKAKQKQFLAAEKLEPYKYLLKQVFESAKYDLSEAEEKIINLKRRPSRDMWTDGVSKLCSGLMVPFEGKSMPLSQAMNMIPQLPVKKRRIMHSACIESLKTASAFAESEMNAICTDKKIEDELRGFAKPYSSTVLRYQNNEKSVEALVEAVKSKAKISHRFYALKAKMMNLPHLEYADRAAGIGSTEKKIELDEAIKIVQSSFSKADPQYTEILNRMLKSGRIDVYPKKGKMGGAFCMGGGQGVPTLVLLNYIPVVDAVMTFAHEMGHAIHTEKARTAPPIYEHYTISAAEVASTFFENLAFEEMFEKLSDKEKVIALHDRIQDYISTVFRQIACFNFELDIHNEIKSKGAISAKEIAALHNKNMGAYLGPKVKLKEDDGYFFIAWNHIRNFFYVYSYAYGILISRAMYEKYKADHSYIKKVDEFMELAATMSPDDIFKSVGIDTSKPEFFKQGLLSIEKDIDRLEKLVAKKK